MKEFSTGAIREDKTGKGRMDLLPMCALIRLSKHFENGAKQYGERNWEKGMPMHGYMDSAMRHLAKYMDGWTDEDHLCAATANLLMAMWTEERKQEMQDLPTRPDYCTKHVNTEKEPKSVCKYYNIDEVKSCHAYATKKECPYSGDEDKCYIPSR